MSAPCKALGAGLHEPLGVQRVLVVGHGVKEDYSGTLRFNAVCPVNICTYLRPVIFFCCCLFIYLFIYLEWECLSYACSTIAIWKYKTYLILQAHSWR